MRWLITGSKGQLGTDLQLQLADEEIKALDLPELDITDSTAVDALVAQFRPDVLINAAAFTAVDPAEEQEELAYKVNATGPAVLAAAIARHGGTLIHISTDYVFAGTATEPYQPGDTPDPQSAYGRTKLAGELAVRELLPEASYVVRTAWVYGAFGGNFVKTMARLESTNETVSVVDDQRGSPTWSSDLASGLIELARRRDSVPTGTYHLTNTGDTTWFGLTQAIFEELGTDPARVLPTTTDKFPRPAPRPAYSVLSPDAWVGAGLTALPHWRDALATAFSRYGDELRPVPPPA